ncbi:hypothetical protein PPERSA_10260 [Pseudocohnilembus persalinus]|uniref:Uncharacterized protein n=1 Tax=Pseudocohnilembus persalinus TaxID=266149 RepID=A0A0V0R0N2_PSEPJ|nr:hypothetical protein PPERSA_10260 [Pseudocohnilembus persalinus]|eukprot:KRX07872.1 hypothetical protein PPERSA_10260 [Pseudocohnilembus persalinus]
MLKIWSQYKDQPLINQIFDEYSIQDKNDFKFLAEEIMIELFGKQVIIPLDNIEKSQKRFSLNSYHCEEFEQIAQLLEQEFQIDQNIVKVEDEQKNQEALKEKEKNNRKIDLQNLSYINQAIYQYQNFNQENGVKGHKI